MGTLTTLFLLSIIETLTTYKNILIVVGAGLSVLIPAFVRSKFFSDLVKGIFDGIFIFREKRKNKKVDVVETNNRNITISIADITNHEIFNYLEFWLYTRIPDITLITQYRTVVFRKYVFILFKEYKEVLTTLLMKQEFTHVEKSQLKSILYTTLINIHKSADAQMKISGIPDVIVAKMTLALKDRMHLALDLINSINESAFYDSDNNLLKVYSYLNIIHSILDNILSNIEPVCNSINGELSGLMMDGFIEPPSKHKS